MKYLIMAAVLVACQSAPSFEDRVKSYMKDSVVTSFNDPKSYEYVSMSADSTFSHQQAKDRLEELQHHIDKENSSYNLNKIELGNEPGFAKITTSHDELINAYNSSVTRYKGYLSRPDSLLHVDIEVRCRAKNAMGALILNTVKLQLQDNKLSVVE